MQRSSPPELEIDPSPPPPAPTPQPPPQPDRPVTPPPVPDRPEQPPDPYPGPDPGEPPIKDPQIRTTSIFADRSAQEMKGRAKQAAGDLTDDEDLKREGQADQAGARAKHKIDEAADNAKAGLDKLTGKARGD